MDKSAVHDLTVGKEELTPLASPEENSLTNQVYRMIKEDILFAKLPAGERLNIVALSKRYNVSRTPVKRALELLTRDNLLETSPGRQAVVKQISLDEIRQNYMIRIQLEPMVAVMSVDLIPMAELQKVAKRIAYLDKHPELTYENMQLDNYLHELFWKYLAAPMVDAIFRAIHEYSVRVRFFIETTSYSSYEHEHDINAEHMAIVNALMQRDADKTKNAIVNHLRCSHRRQSSAYQATMFQRGEQA